MDEKKITCAHCGAEIEPNHVFCPYCGSRIENDGKKSKWVEMSGWDYKDDEPEETTRFDGSDDRKPHYQTYVVPSESEYKKKKAHKGCLLIVLIPVLLVAAYLGYDFYNFTKVDMAKSSAAEFSYQVLCDAVLLEDIGVEIGENWRATIWDNKYADVDDAFKAVFDEHSDDVSKLFSNYSEITKMYQDALALSEKAKLSALADAVRDLYSKYTDLYNAVFLFNCSYSEFIDNYNAADTKLGLSIQTIVPLLEDYLITDN